MRRITCQLVKHLPLMIEEAKSKDRKLLNPKPFMEYVTTRYCGVGLGMALDVKGLYADVQFQKANYGLIVTSSEVSEGAIKVILHEPGTGIVRV